MILAIHLLVGLMQIVIMVNALVLLNIPRAIPIKLVAQNAFKIMTVIETWLVFEINAQTHALEYAVVMHCVKFTIMSLHVVVPKACLEIPSLIVDLIIVRIFIP